MARMVRMPGPVAMAMTAWSVWRRIPPSQRRLIISQARKHAPTVAKQVRKHAPTVARQLRNRPKPKP